MDVESGEKKAKKMMVWSTKSIKVCGWVLVLLRVGALVGMCGAAFVMGNNKQTKSIAVAAVGTTTIFKTLTVKFQHTPAFVYFVIANAIGGAYNLSVMLLISFVKSKGIGILVHHTDLVILVLVGTGAAAATSMAELGKNGNSHARWFPVCDKFDAFCFRGGAALISSIIGAALFLILHMITLHKHVAKP